LLRNWLVFVRYSLPTVMTTPALERAKALAAAQNRTIGMIANGARLPEVLDELCRVIDALTPGLVSTVLLMDPDGTRLWPGAGPRFPPALRPAINPWMIGPNRGACGTAAFLKERVIIADVTSDPRWPDEYRSLAISHGLCASWSQPLITNAGTVLGTFAMYYAEPRVPDPSDLDLIEAAGQVALIAIQMERSQAALSMVSRRLIDAQEKERARLARELHDDINQRLALIALSLNRLKSESAGAGRFHEEIAAASAHRSAAEPAPTAASATPFAPTGVCGSGISTAAHCIGMAVGMSRIVIGLL